MDVSRLETTRRREVVSSECRELTDGEVGNEAALNWVMFWSNCDHEVERIKGGERVVLIFNLMFRGEAIHIRNKD